MPAILKKLYQLLSAEERRQLHWLMPAIVVMAILEVVGIASVMPFLSVVSDPGQITKSKSLHAVYTTFGFSGTYSFLVALGAGALGVLVVSNVFSSFTKLALFRFSYMCGHYMSQRLLAKYLNQPYAYFLDKNSAALTKNLLAEVHRVVSGVFVPALTVIARVIASLVVLAFIVLLDPVLAVIVLGLLGGAYVLMDRAIKKTLDRIGDETAAVTAERFRAASETFGGIKEIKLLGVESESITRFDEPSRTLARNRATSQVLGQLPKYVLEIIAFGSIILMTLYFLWQQEELSSILPVLGLYAFAGYRMLPAMQQIFFGVTSMRYNAAALDALTEDMEGSSQVSLHYELPPPLPFEKQIELRNLSFRYPSADRDSLRSVNLTISKNTSIGLVGSTGAGKTTIVDILLGLLWPTSGELLVDGTAVDETNLRAWQQNVGYVPQHIFLRDQSILRNIAFGVNEADIDREAAIEAAKIANLHDFIMHELPQQYDTVVGERGVRLSGGQRQRIGIARALYRNPKLLVLDEATSALDSVTESAVMEAISALGRSKTVVMIAHRLSTIQACDKIFVFDHGQIIGAGSFNELLETNETFRQLAIHFKT